MLHFTSDQWVQWLGVYFWPMLRILALISTAPILSERSIPKRVKVGLGVSHHLDSRCPLPCRRSNVPLFTPANGFWVAVAAGDDWRRGWLYHAAGFCRRAYGR